MTTASPKVGQILDQRQAMAELKRIVLPSIPNPPAESFDGVQPAHLRKAPLPSPWRFDARPTVTMHVRPSLVPQHATEIAKAK